MGRFYPLAVVWMALSLLSAAAVRAEPEPEERWAVYYGESLPSELFTSYNLVVFDSEKHPRLRPLRNRKITLLGYLSLGEAEDYRSDFKDIRALGVLLDENKNWPGHYAVDLRNPKWAKYIIEEKIPAILFKRFDGIMLDTIDTPLYLETQDERYKGMREAAINLLREIRMHYPTLKIMLNRGFDAFPEVAEHVDMILSESTLADASEKEEPAMTEEADYLRSVELLKQAQEHVPGLKVYSLDYWDPEDEEGVQKLMDIQRSNGFIPFVSTPDLQGLPGAVEPESLPAEGETQSEDDGKPVQPEEPEGPDAP